MIAELKIKNFRGFDSLELQGLQRVNLIVGDNNAGKTSLLEALCLVADPGSWESLPGRFREHEGDAVVRYFQWLSKDGAEMARIRAAQSNGQASWATFSESDRENGCPPDEDEWRVRIGHYELCHGGSRQEVRAVSVHLRSAATLAKAFSSAKSGPQTALNAAINIADK